MRPCPAPALQPHCQRPPRAMGAPQGRQHPAQPLSGKSSLSSNGHIPRKGLSSLERAAGVSCAGPEAHLLQGLGQALTLALPAHTQDTWTENRSLLQRCAQPTGRGLTWRWGLAAAALPGAPPGVRPASPPPATHRSVGSQVAPSTSPLGPGPTSCCFRRLLTASSFLASAAFTLQGHSERKPQRPFCPGHKGQGPLRIRSAHPHLPRGQRSGVAGSPAGRGARCSV